MRMFVTKTMLQMLAGKTEKHVHVHTSLHIDRTDSDVKTFALVVIYFLRAHILIEADFFIGIAVLKICTVLLES